MNINISPLYIFNMSKKRFQTIFIIFLSLGFIGLQSLSTFAQVQLIQPEIEEKVNELLQQMTLEEKIGQLNLHNGSWDITGPVPEGGYQQARYNLLKSGGVGAMLNVIGVDATMAAQKIAVDSSRLGIPLMFGYDVVHGYQTMFPVPIAELASFDIDIMEETAKIQAIEAAAGGINWTFAPMIDVGRDPRWGRVMEGTSEDPYLLSEFARAKIRGLQGANLSETGTIAATVKHFAGYAFAESGKDYNTAELSRNTLLNVVLPPFRAAVEEGAASVMNSFNDVNGIPATGDEYLQRTQLKENWGFDGFVVSDWGSMREMIAHGYAPDLQTATEMAIEAGSDMDMESEGYQQYLQKLVKSGIVDMKLVDDAVRRVLRVKFHLGLFDDPYLYNDLTREDELVYNEAHHEVALRAALGSMVLVENKDEILPLSKQRESIAVIGLLAKDKDSPLGNWRAQAIENSAVSVLEGIESKLGDNTEIEFEPGYVLTEGNRSFPMELTFSQEDESGFQAAIDLAAEHDQVILVVGEDAYQTGEGRSQMDIGLADNQQKLVEQILEVNDQVVVVLMSGRPIIAPLLYEKSEAVLYSWHLGTEAGHAIADVLFGDYNPSGRLPMTVPFSHGQIPVYYNHKSTGRPVPGIGDEGKVFWSHYTDGPNAPQYPFGYGLSYSTFKYGVPSMSDTLMNSEESVVVKIDVTNTSNLDGEEVIQWYIHDHFANAARPIKEFKYFEKELIKAGETRTFMFEISEETLKYYDHNEEYVAEPGSFSVMVGPNSRKLQTIRFHLDAD